MFSCFHGRWSNKSVNTTICASAVDTVEKEEMTQWSNGDGAHKLISASHIYVCHLTVGAVLFL